jgi:uncharacterized membrane-anchored protein YitT (DUF2179 family)
LHDASGEVLPRFGSIDHEPEVPEHHRSKAWFRHSTRRRQLISLIITDQGEKVAGRILSAMKRGVTGLPGQGMYTGSAHTVLICALTITEVQHLKALVNSEDPNAFMIVIPAQEILGKGFNPLQHLVS